MSDRVEFGYAANRADLWCAKRVSVAGWMLCGRRKSWMPPVPHPFVPTNLCPDCARILAGGSELRPVVDEQAEGTCPVCVGRAPLDEAGLVAKHDQWSWSGGRLIVLAGQACAGAGERPEFEG